MEIALILLFIITGAVLLLLGVWFLVYLFGNDLAVPVSDLRELSVKRVLAIFPHPDDECLTVGGTLRQLRSLGIDTYLLILTKGEAYTENPPENVKEIRSNELHRSGEILKISQVRHLDLGDGQIDQNKEESYSEIGKAISEINPDLLITFDLSGMYGHPDHISTAESVTQLARVMEIPLWYTVMPERRKGLINLPTEMAEDQEFEDHRSKAEFRVRLRPVDLFAKIRSVYSHRSQLNAFRLVLPVKSIPLWFYLSVAMYEYFAVGYEGMDVTADAVNGEDNVVEEPSSVEEKGEIISAATEDDQVE